MRTTARFEIVRTDVGHHARFRAGNGRIVWWTENYTRRAKALRAVHLIAKPAEGTPWPLAVWVQSLGAIEVREVDER